MRLLNWVDLPKVRAVGSFASCFLKEFCFCMGIIRFGTGSVVRPKPCFVKPRLIPVTLNLADLFSSGAMALPVSSFVAPVRAIRTDRLP